MLSAIFSGVGYLITAAIYVGVILIMSRTHKMLRDENNALRIMNVKLTHEVCTLRLMCKNQRSKSCSSTQYAQNSDVVEAVKFAMYQAHPDNPNGSHERFIKYKELYERIK